MKGQETPETSSQHGPSVPVDRQGAPYLDQEDDEEVEVGDSAELLEQVLGDEVPEGVLEEGRGL